MTSERVRELWRCHAVEIAVAVTGVLALFCYGFVLRLPFFRDDLPIMTWLSSRSWAEIWTRSSENQFYRPLAFTIYKLGRQLPSGADRVTLHAVSLLIHWASACLVIAVVKLRGRSDEEALLAATLFVVFPFTFMAIPWITAMSHPLVTVLTLLAVAAALKSQQVDAMRWWGLSLLATVLAPMAHESGYLCGVMVAGVLLIERGLGRVRRLSPLVFGIGLNVATLIWRSSVPGAGRAAFIGLRDWVGNTMFSLHGLVYPLGSLIGTLVSRFGIQDFLLVLIAAIGLVVVSLALTLRDRDPRWMASGLWWWACGVLPAAVSLSYGYNYTSPRVYSLAAPGLAMVWAALIVKLASVAAARWFRIGIALSLSTAIVTQNVAFLRRQRHLFTTLNAVYRRVLDVAAYDGGEPAPGFVNLPSSLAYPEKTYAMILETVLFVPPYSDLQEFFAVNGLQQADAVVFSPVVVDSGYVCALRGEGLAWDDMRQFAVEHESIWLARWRGGRMTLDQVGSIEADAQVASSDPLVTFEDGIAIESASMKKTAREGWAVAIDWLAQGPVDAQVFVHVRDANGRMVMQADGPALGGMIPPWSWRRGDRIHDVRYVSACAASPCSIQVGLFNQDGRYPAYLGEGRCADDVCPLTSFDP